MSQADASVGPGEGGAAADAASGPHGSGRTRASGGPEAVANCATAPQVTDVSAEVSLETARAAATARAERLLKVTAAIADAVSSEQVFEALVDHVADASSASSAGLWLVDDEGKHIELVRARGYVEAARQKLARLPIELTPSMPVLDCVRTQQAVWIASQVELFEKYPHLVAVATPGRSYRVCCLPLIARGRTLGAIGMTIEEAREPDEEERDFLLLVARYATQSVERLRLFEAERRSRAEADASAHRLRVLAEASRAFVGSALELEKRLDVIVRQLATALRGCINLALIASDGLLHSKAVHHPNPEAQELLRKLAPTAPLRIGEGITGSIAASGKSTILPAIDTDVLASRAAPAYRAFLERFPAYAMIGAPLCVQGRVIGTVTATRVREGETYTREDLRLLEDLAERAAATIENSRLYEETHQGRLRAEQLYRFAQAVVAAETIETVFDAALASIEAALGATRAAVLTFDSDGIMRFKAWHNLSDAYRRAVEGHSPWPADAVNPEPVLVPHAVEDPAMASYAPLFRSEGIGALAFIPLVTRGKLLGKFMVYYDEPHAFTSQELETGRAISNHLASVITRFRVMGKLEETIRYNELFTGILAHDLRNPLGAIMTAAQLLLVRHEGEGVRNGSDARPLGRILSSGKRMTTMIDQLLDLTRVRSGSGIDIHPRAANLAELCGEAVSELELAYPNWTIRRDVRGDQSGSWDPERLVQVISNLVANAGHHGEADSEIAIKLDGQLPDVVVFEIHNQGTIPAWLLPTLFDPFRGTRHRGQAKGLGLGLFIVKEIVRAHGGTVEVASTESAGTTFTIRLPRHAAHAGA
jgi:K+-sensing histidine kinase KdpD